MKKRPLCIFCLTFLLINGLILILAGGQSYQKVPASSIFYELDKIEGTKEILIQGQVYKKEEKTSYQILYLKNNSISYRNKSFQESKIIVYDDTFEPVSIGEEIALYGQLNQFEGARNPGNFNQKMHYAKQRIHGFVWSKKVISVTGTENILKEKLYQFRQAWKKALLQSMSKENGGILSAILLSEKSDMDTEVKELYQKTGIGHVLAISGLHISFIGLGIYRIFRKLGISYTLSGIMALTVLTVYVVMIGFSVSVMRAYIMLIFRIGADIFGHVYDMVTALMFSAALTVVWQPLYLMDGGFYMSYGAILGILFVRVEVEKLLFAEKKWMKTCISGFAVNLTLFPILLLFYYEIPTYSLLLNLIVIPLMSWVMGLGMFGSLFYLIYKPLGGILWKIADWILSFYQMAGEFCSHLPSSSIVFGEPEGWKIILYYSFLMLVILYLSHCNNQKVIKTVRKYVFLGFLILTVSFVPIPNGKLRITMIDVGQGDSIFMRGPWGRTYLIDGGSSDVNQVGKYRIESFLKSQGVGSLDYVFVTHGDSDHYSGIEEMIKRQQFGVKIKKLIFPANYQNDEELVRLAKLAEECGIEAAVIRKGDKLQEGKLEITCVQPAENGELLTGNAGSLVLDVTFESFDMLCTGDVEKEGEEILQENIAGKSYEVLKVAHHGSKYSTSQELLSVIRPDIALISAGENNSYGHPHEETLNRLEAAGSVILQTSEYGAISIETNGEVIDIFPPSI